MRFPTRHQAVCLLWLHVAGLAAWLLWAGHPPVGLALGLAASLAIGGSFVRANPYVLAVSLAGMSGALAVGLAGTGSQSFADLDGLMALCWLVVLREKWAIAAAGSTLVLTRIALTWLTDTAPTQAGWDTLLVVALTLFWCCRAQDVASESAKSRLAAAVEAASQAEAALRLGSEEATNFAALAVEDQMAREFEARIGGLVGQAASAALGMRSAAGQITEATGEAARRTTEIATTSQASLASAQSVASAVERLATNISKVTEEINQVSETSFQAMDEAGSTNATVQQLADAAQRIGVVVKVISLIAGKTKLLALNATIEAARAGEAGRGFTIVANEVKELAQQTAGATVDIEREIAAILQHMTEAMAVIDGMATTVANLGGISVSVAGAMHEQADIAREIAAAALDAATGTESVVQHLQQLTEQAAVGDVAARHSAEDAENLAVQCGAVETATRAFIATLLAA